MDSKTRLASFAVQQLEGIAVVRLCENLDAVQFVNHAVAVDISADAALVAVLPELDELAAPLQIFAVSSDQIQMDTEDECQRFQQHWDYLQVMVVYIYFIFFTTHDFAMLMHSVFNFQSKTKRQSGLT